MNLGFESLGFRNYNVSTEDLMSETIQTILMAQEAMECADTLETINQTMCSLEELGSCVRTYGYTQSVNQLFGENFAGGFSMEGLGDKIKAGWNKFVEWLKSLWAKIKAFFAYFFGNADKMIKKLEERKKEIASKGVRQGTVKMVGATILNNIYQAFKKDLKPMLDYGMQVYQEAAKETPDIAALQAGAEHGLNSAKLVESVLDNVDKDDNVTLTNSNATAMLDLCISGLKCVKELKSLNDKLHDLAMKACTAIAKAAHSTGDKEMAQAGVAAAKVGRALLDSPQGREAVSKISAKIAKVLSKATRGWLAISSHMLSVCKAGSGAASSSNADDKKDE